MMTLNVNSRTTLALLAAAALAAPILAEAGSLAPRAAASAQQPHIAGHYLEVRSCDVYTGYCFANSEMGLAGKEGMLVWSIDRGAWDGVPLDGLKVIAVIHADKTLGDVRYQPRVGRAVLITDARASEAQKRALVDFARSMSGSLTAEVEAVRESPITADLGTCTKRGCARVAAPGLVEISTRCLSDKDDICGNEETYYPPLTHLDHSMPAFSELAAYRGNDLDVTWEGTGQRNVFLGEFSR